MTALWSLVLQELDEEGNKLGFDDEEDEPENDFAEIDERIGEIESQLNSNAVPRAWDAHHLRQKVDSLAEYWPSKKKRELAGRLKQTKARALDIADRAPLAARVAEIDESLRATFTNSVSVMSLVRRLNELGGELKQSGNLTDVLESKLRQARERAAQYRAGKKADEARVAGAGGNDKKRDKFMCEAEALLKQDWAAIFPGEEPPTEGFLGGDTNHGEN